MIERQIINGRPARVAYMDPEGNMASKSMYAFARVLFDDGGSMFLVNPDHDAQLEAASWNRHRERHRRPVGQPPFELRRKSRREQSPHNAAIAGFTTAINEAEKHRRVLRRRFGYTDPQIGTMAMNYNSRKTTR